MTKDDLELFHRDLVIGQESLPPLKLILHSLYAFHDDAKTSTKLSKILQPVKREVRRCQRDVETTEAEVQSSVDQAATLIEEGKFQEALPVMLDGHKAIRGSIERVDKLKVALHEVPSKAGKVRAKADLVAINRGHLVEQTDGARRVIIIW